MEKYKQVNRGPDDGCASPVNAALVGPCFLDVLYPLWFLYPFCLLFYGVAWVLREVISWNHLHLEPSVSTFLNNVLLHVSELLSDS